MNHLIDLGWIWAGAVLAILMIIAVHDIRTMEIPYRYNGAIAILGILAGLFLPDVSWLERGIGLLCVTLPMIVVNMIRKDSFGGGDILLVAAGGLLLGWRGMLEASLIAMMAGGILAAFLLISGRRGRREHFAFGPCLALGIGWMTIRVVDPSVLPGMMALV